MTIAAFILSIICLLWSITLPIIGAWGGLILSIVTLILAFLGRKKAVAAEKSAKMATAGIVMSLISTGLFAYTLIRVYILLDKISSMSF